MKKKIIILIILLLSVTGCTTDYNLIVEDDFITENIVATIPYTSNNQSTKEKKTKIEADNQVIPFLKNPQYVFDEKDGITYNKTVQKDKNNNYIVNLYYKYSFNDYLKSKAYNRCFQESYINKEKNGNIPIVFKGKFYCLYGDKINVNITSSRKVLGNNADQVNGDTYTWVIDSSNMDNTDIQIVFSNEKISNPSNIISLILVGIIIIIIIVDINIVKKKKNQIRRKRRRRDYYE